LQLPAPSQNPEQQALQLSLQLQVPPQLTPSEIQVSAGAASQTPPALQYPEQHMKQFTPSVQLAEQSAPLSLHTGAPPQASADWQVPAPPGMDGSSWQQIKPSWHAPWTPPLHGHPSPVQREPGQLSIV
jgi:hypothetical protein